MLTIYTIKERVFDFDCCQSVLNLNIVERMFKDSLACIQNFVESDDKIQVIWNVGDVGNMECCVMLGCWMLVM